MKKGDRASSAELKYVPSQLTASISSQKYFLYFLFTHSTAFKTDDVMKVAEIMIEKGELQVCHSSIPEKNDCSKLIKMRD